MADSKDGIKSGILSVLRNNFPREEYEEKIREYAEQDGVDDVETYKEQVGEDVLRNTILAEVVTDYLVEECVQVEDSDTAQ